MEFTSKKLKNSDLELTISLDRKDIDFYIKKATDELQGSVRIDGYRQGKVPDDLLKKNVGEDRIKENALNIAVQESLQKLIEKENFEVFDYFDLKIKENKPDKLIYTVFLSLFPEVKLGSYDSLKINSKPISVSDEEIENTLKEIQETRTEYKDSDQSAKEGDRVEVDFEVTDNGQLIEGGKSENHPLIIGKKTFVPGFEEKLKDMKVGEEKSFMLRIPIDYHEKNIAGKELDFKVIMKKISYPTTPVLDDTFVQSLGNFANLGQLRQNVQAGLLEEKKTKESERIKLAILDEIIKNTKVVIPSKFLEKQLDAIISNFDQELHQRGLEIGLYLAHLKKTQEEFRKSFVPQAEKQVKTELIIREIGKKESIIIADSEIDERLQEINSAINLQDEIVGRGLDVATLRNRIRQVLFNEKIFQFLLKKATIVPA